MVGEFPDFIPLPNSIRSRRTPLFLLLPRLVLFSQHSTYMMGVLNFLNFTGFTVDHSSSVTFLQGLHCGVSLWTRQLTLAHLKGYVGLSLTKG